MLLLFFIIKIKNLRQFSENIWKLLRPPLIQFSKFNNFLWVWWFLGRNLSNFVPPVWKVHKPYAIEDNYHFTYNSVLFQNTFPDAGINQTLLTILALSPYFKKIQDIFYTIRPKLEYLQSEMMANNSENALQDLAIR